MMTAQNSLESTYHTTWIHLSVVFLSLAINIYHYIPFARVNYTLQETYLNALLLLQ